MRINEAVELARTSLTPEWGNLRAARVQKRILAALQAPERVLESKRGRYQRRAAFAALAALAMLGVLVLWEKPRAEHRLELPDGSRVVAAPETRVIADTVTPARVELRQLGGSAHYEVSHRPSRSFVVFIDDVSVSVVGTTFDVEKSQVGTRVAVVHGRVEVSRGGQAVILTDGEELLLGPRTGAVRAPPSSRSNPPPAIEGSEPPEPVAIPTASSGELASAATLFRQADNARTNGNDVEALRLLRSLVHKYPRDGRVTLAYFTIGRIEARRGRASIAADAFEACGTALEGEALAEAALLRRTAGQVKRAEALARTYLELYGSGPRAKEMAGIAR